MIRTIQTRTFHLPVVRQFYKGQHFKLPFSKSISIEIGCGDGTHSLHYCQQNPKKHLIAIEKSPVRFRKFQKKINQLSQVPKNLHPIQANAISWIVHFIPSNSIEKLYILYPNPYPKKSQKNKRWHAMPFMGELIKKLQPEGQIILATNEHFYLQEAQEYFQFLWKMEYLKKENFYKESLEIDDSKKNRKAKTAFEKKYLQQGDSCYYLTVQKPKDITTKNNGHVAQ